MASVYTVSQVTAYIRNMFTQDFALNRISIRGEVSNCKYHTSGHIYFTLKDGGAQIAAVMFAGQRKGLDFELREGQEVTVSGTVDVYERDGRYQLYAKEITREGKGDLFRQFEKLRNELEEMGMFDSCYKQPIPKYARKVGIVTAGTGAAIRDIMNISARRNPYVQLILYPALVQGEQAKYSIAKGIETLDRMGLDVLIVGRGGGSIEDLWAFNEEEVARAIFNCKTPVISAVGHETDTTIADLVADLRAPTPSAAAELAVGDVRMLFRTFEDYRAKLSRSVENRRARLLGQHLRLYQNKLRFLSPENQIREKRRYLMDLEDKMEATMKNQIYMARRSLDIYIERMKGLSPLEKLNQGIFHVENAEHHAVTSIEQVKADDTLYIQVSDGCIAADVSYTQALGRGERAGFEEV